MAFVTKTGKQVTWLFENDQGHGFIGNEVNQNLYERVLAFIALNTASRGAD